MQGLYNMIQYNKTGQNRKCKNATGYDRTGQKERAVPGTREYEEPRKMIKQLYQLCT